jgi:hypothetical protein
MAADGAARPLGSVDGLRPPSLTTGPPTASGRSIPFMLGFIVPVSSRTNGCPEKPGAAQSVIAMSGLTFDLSTPHGRMLATVVAGIAEFERELIRERVRSGMAAAKARGKRLGRQPGQRPKSDRLAPKVLALVARGRSYRLIGRELGLSKNTVADIVRRKRAASAGG